METAAAAGVFGLFGIVLLVIVGFIGLIMMGTYFKLCERIKQMKKTQEEIRDLLKEKANK